MRTHTKIALGLTIAAALLAGGCGDKGSSSSTIPQPVVEDLPVAPESERVDLATPTFSDPTSVTNPLFPISNQASVLLLGEVDGEPFRTEVTLLPETRIIEWEGKQVEVLVSQYVAYLDGRIHEVALDFYAQDDDGAVWYFGEDVFNFEDGAIADTHGTWIAGKDGPAAMIMPADPQVGDVYRPENIPGFVFEEVTVKAVDETLDGPLGPGRGRARDRGAAHGRHHRGARPSLPGYGEFFTGGGGDVEALALAVPTDALGEPTPAELVTLERGAADVFDAAETGGLGRGAGRGRGRRRPPGRPSRAGEVPDAARAAARAARSTRSPPRSTTARRPRPARRRSTSHAGASTCSSATGR